MHMHARLAIALLALALVPAAHAQEPPPSPAAPAVERLSDPGHVSRWAFVLRRAIVRKTPDPHAKAVARLRLRTQDGTDELVAVLARTTDEAGRTWIRVRLPILPNNTTGWVTDETLGHFNVVRTWLKIDTKRLQAKLIRSGRLVFRSRIGIGQKRWPTPKGNFYVRDRLQGFPPGSIYGALAFGLNARSAVLTDWPGGGFVGIHGTNQPYLLPGRISHGCIRMKNRDILRLARMMRVGTPVTIY